MPQCKAKSKQSGERCKRPAVKGKEVCYIHGGATPSGVASLNFKHGRYSKELPDRLLEKYEAMMRDENLLELRHEIALVDARLGDILQRVDTGESGRLWRELKVELQDYRAAAVKQDVGEMTLHLNNMTHLVDAGIEDWATWEEVGKQVDRRARLVDAERKRIESAEHSMSYEQLMVLMAYVLDVIRKNVTDRKILNLIATGLRERIE